MCAALSACGDLDDDPGHVLGRDGLLCGAVALEQRAHVLAVDVLHGEEVLVVGVGELVDPGDVVVLEQRRHLGLVHQHVMKSSSCDEVAEHPLDRDQVRAPAAVECLGAEDLRHAAEGHADRAAGIGLAVAPGACLNESSGSDRITFFVRGVRCGSPASLLVTLPVLWRQRVRRSRRTALKIDAPAAAEGAKRVWRKFTSRRAPAFT